MSESIRATLLALKDVRGIEGSFLLNGEGALLAMEMPPLFEVSMFAELGPRIERFAETFSSLGDELESCLVRFSDHLLCIKQFGKSGVLCILSSTSVNLPALRMATNLAHRRLAAEILNVRPVATAPPPAVAPAEVKEVAPAATGGTRPGGHSVRYYRGHLVED